jgi:hypothetical protein
MNAEDKRNRDEVSARADGPADLPLPKDGPARPAPDSPLADYLLELEQEFQDQEEEGKIHLVPGEPEAG